MLLSTHKSGITIGVSSCLLGERVRYDGQHKRHAAIVDNICTIFNCIAICPEIGIGLGVPREPIQIVISNGNKRAIHVNEPHQDVTDRLLAYADKIADLYTDLDGYIVKSRSPSCGLHSAPQNSCKSNSPIDSKSDTFGPGIYTRRILTRKPKMPMIEEQDITGQMHIDRFVDDVKVYAQRLK